MTPFQSLNYFELLEVPHTATEVQIRAAYERALTLYAPDSVALYVLEDPAQAEQLRALVTEAMEFLTDSDLRAEYHKQLGLPPPSECVPALEQVGALLQQAAAGAEPAQAPPSEAAPSASEAPAAPPQAAVQAQAPAPAPSASEAPPGPVEASPAPQAPAASPRPSPPPALRLVRPLGEAPRLAEESAIAMAEASMARAAAVVRGREAARPKPLDIPEEAEFSGELLRRVREARGYSLNQLADRTRISSRHLENIEADRYKDLPAPVYLRGMLTSMARELGLDAARVSRSYMELVSRASGTRR